MSDVVTLILPGLGDSGPEHWQTRWEAMDVSCRRVRQAEWNAPRCADWAAVLDDTVAALAGEAVLVTHSSSCALVAHWARTAPAEHLARIRGALLVAPSDPDAPAYPPEPTGFAPVPMERLPFPSIVVASTNDEYVTLEQARAYAGAWGSEFVNAGALGDINSASGLGEWPFGYALLQRLRAGPATRPG